MSDLQKSFARAKLASLPPILPESFPEEQEADTFSEYRTDWPDDDSSSASSASSASSTGTIIPGPSRNLFARPHGPPHRPSPYAPLPWTPYFTRTLLLPHTTSTHLITHHIYLTPPSPTGPLFVTHHGAGSSGLSFALLAGHLRALLPNCGILSLDARGHGLTTVEPFPGVPFDSGLDTSLETLTADVPIILDLTQKALSWPTLPNIILIGHSLGGSVVTSVASQGLLGSALLGYAVLDIVEKTAIDALVAMAGFLASRPRSFPTLEKGVEWHVRSGTLRNAQSARVSVPALLRWEGEGEVREQGHDKKNGDGGGEGEGKEGLAKWLLKGDKDGKKGKWVWRTDLKETEPFWEGWFTGLNKRFLEARGGKLLLLAGTDRLDKDMMIGQMQGKYALQVFPDAGHFVHEDQPERAANVIAEFYRRNDRSALVLPPKVADLLKAGKKV